MFTARYELGPYIKQYDSFGVVNLSVTYVSVSVGGNRNTNFGVSQS